MAFEEFDPENALQGELYLGPEGSELKLPPGGRGQLQTTRIEETRSEEMASGRLVKDVLWRKKEFTIPYSELKGENLEQIIELYNLKEYLNFIQVQRGGEIEEHLVEFQPFDQNRIDFHGDWYWADVELVLRKVNPDAASN